MWEEISYILKEEKLGLRESVGCYRSNFSLVKLIMNYYIDLIIKKNCLL